MQRLETHTHDTLLFILHGSAIRIRQVKYKQWIWPLLIALRNLFLLICNTVCMICTRFLVVLWIFSSYKFVFERVIIEVMKLPNKRHRLNSRVCCVFFHQALTSTKREQSVIKNPIFAEHVRQVNCNCPNCRIKIQVLQRVVPIAFPSFGNQLLGADPTGWVLILQPTRS